MRITACAIGLFSFFSAFSAFSANTIWADDGGALAHRNTVAVRIGPRAITVGEIEDRIAEMPRFQLLEYGSTADEIRKRFVHDVIVPEVLLSIEGEKSQLGKKEPTIYEVERALSNASLRDVRRRVTKPEDIPAPEVEAYYNAHRDRFDSPERIAVWRILCDSQAKAEDVLAVARKEKTPEAFLKLARESSIDKSTYLRGGNLGFIAADGSSNEAGLHVEPSLFKAAAGVKDGEFVDSAVPEGANFAVIWRRGTRAASHRTVEEASMQIRDSIFREKIDGANRALIEELNAKHVRDKHADILEGIPVPEVEISPRGPAPASAVTTRDGHSPLPSAATSAAPSKPSGAPSAASSAASSSAR